MDTFLLQGLWVVFVFTAFIAAFFPLFYLILVWYERDERLSKCLICLTLFVLLFAAVFISGIVLIKFFT